MWANEPKMARKWTDEHGSTPDKAKKGKYQDFKHPQHDILPLEHMEEKVSSKERVERLLEDRKKKKSSEGMNRKERRKLAAAKRKEDKKSGKPDYSKSKPAGDTNHLLT